MLLIASSCNISLDHSHLVKTVSFLRSNPPWFLVVLILNLPFSTLMIILINLMSSYHGQYEHSFLVQAHEWHLTQIEKKIVHGLVHKVYFAVAYRTTKSLDVTWYTIYACELTLHNPIPE